MIRNCFYFLAGAAIVLLHSCHNSEGHVVKKDTIDSTSIVLKMINADGKKKMLDTFFDHRFVDGKFSGCVLVAQRGIVLYEKAFGWANHEKRDSLSLTSSFQLASVSKQFTAAAIMLLHQQGKLDYDDTVGKFIPGFGYPLITIRELLTHRAGLDKYTNICDNYFRKNDIEPGCIDNDSAIGIMEMLHTCPVRQPDKKFDYSNTGYVVLASVVEKISGEKFCDFMKKNFFDPLGMSHTWIATDGLAHPGKTKGYFGKWSEWRDNYLDGVCGDKGVFSSVDDLFKWDRALKKGTILTPTTLKEAFTGYSPELDGKRYWNYGFGWRTITFDDGANAVFHNGWWHGYTSAFYRGLTDDVTVIILCNKYNKGIYNMTPLLELLGAHHLPMPDDENAQDADSAPVQDNKTVKGAAPSANSLRHASAPHHH